MRVGATQAHVVETFGVVSNPPRSNQARHNLWIASCRRLDSAHDDAMKCTERRQTNSMKGWGLHVNTHYRSPQSAITHTP